MTALQYVSVHQHSLINSTFKLILNRQSPIHLTNRSYAWGLYSVPQGL